MRNAKKPHGQDACAICSLLHAWEIGRLRSACMRDGQFDACKELLRKLRQMGLDWHHGDLEPYGYEKRFDMPEASWPHEFQKYKRDALIQKDLEYLADAVFSFYRQRPDNFIRSNGKIWGGFCEKQVDYTGRPSGYLELTRADYDFGQYRFVMTRNSIIPEPESQVEHQFSSYGKLAIQKLKDFVNPRKDMTTESYRFFVQHAYNQVFVRESFLHSAKSSAIAKLVGSVIQGKSTKLAGYVWYFKKTSTTRISANVIGERVDLVEDEEENDDEDDE